MKNLRLIIVERLVFFLGKNKIIVIILILAASLRFIGLYPGYPSQHPDEGAASAAFEMISHKNLDPLRYDYPSGVSIIQLIFFELFFIPLNWLKVLTFNIGNILSGDLRIPFNQMDLKILHDQVFGRWDTNYLFWGRYVTALFGSLVVLLTYILAKRFFNIYCGLTAAFFVAVNFREVLNSHIGLPDIYNAFFLLLSFVLSDNLFKRPSLKNYLLIGLVLGMSFSIKYQIFAFIPFITVHLILAIKLSKKNFLNFVRFFISWELINSILVVIMTVILINPYHIIKFDQFWTAQKAVSAKYGMGTNRLNFYPLAYLYHFGIGEILSFLIIIGIILGVAKNLQRSFILLSAILPFMYIFIYYSRGGFYTRNFVTIIPLLMIFAAIPFQLINDSLSRIFRKYFPQKNKIFLNIVIIFLIVVAAFSNLDKSLTIIRQYVKPWNLEILKSWVKDNIPAGSTVSANNNIPLPENIKQLDYDFDHAFSIDEFTGDGNFDYAITNFIWATGSFYWWMNVNTEEGINYFNKPVDIMEYTYSAIALRELEPYSVYPVFKPWVSPDSDFLVVKVPKFQIKEKEEKISYFFNKGNNGWSKEGSMWLSANNLIWQNDSLVVKEEPPSLPSIRWQSPVINTLDWPGFVVEYKMQSKLSDKLSDETLKTFKGGYIFVNFYKSKLDAKLSKNRIGARVSSRINTPNVLQDKNLIGVFPDQTKYITIGFSSYNYSNSWSELNSLILYKADITTDLNGVKVSPIHIDENNLYPNSHGNL